MAEKTLSTWRLDSAGGAAFLPPPECYPKRLNTVEQRLE